MPTCRLLAVYEEPAQAAQAIAAVRAGRLGEVGVYAPIPHRRLEDAMAAGTSPVRACTLAGGLLGCASGFALTIYTALDWPLMTGGKPIVSIPPFVIIAFELTILFAVLGSFLGFVIFAGLPQLRPRPLYDARFTEDRYGVLVTCSEDQSGAVRAVLEGFDAEEIRSETA